jgi:hypothetical protein
MPGRGDLGQVGDAQHLPLAPERAQLLARPIAATAPPMPESTSSNTMVGTASVPSAATSIASEIRDSSPPEATLRSGRGGWPALADTRKSARSAPCGSGVSLSSVRAAPRSGRPAHAKLGDQCR